jgi:hypothetical protein
MMDPGATLVDRTIDETIEGAAVSRTNRAKLVVIVLLYALVLGSVFAPSARETMQAAFGPEPLGIPIDLFVVGLVTLALLPFIWVVNHMAPIVVQGLRDGRGVSAFGMIAYVFQVGKRHPVLRRSQFVCLFGLAYFIALCAAWIALANLRGY